MPDALRLYFRYIAISIRAQLQYRLSLIMQAIGMFIITGIEFIGVWAMFDRFGSLRGWTLAEVAFFYGLIDITFAIADAVARGFDQVPGLIRAGDLDRLLLRPRSTVLQLAGYELTLRRVGRLTQGLVIFIWASAAMDLDWTIAKLLLLAATIVGAVCMFWGLVIIQGTIAFWTIESLELMNSFTYGGNATGQFPIDIYRTWFRRFFTFVIPLACINYLPGLAIMGRTDPLGTAPVMQWLAPVAGVLFFAIALQFWRFGVRHYVSTGS